MKHIIVDLEMNNIARGQLVRHVCSRETIEIGAVMLDNDMREISSFRTYVRPEYTACIVPVVAELTGITFDMVQNAPTFAEALRMFTNWCLGTGDEVTLYSWSDTDYNHIVKEMLMKSYIVSTAEVCVLERPWQDFQAEFDHHLGFEKMVSLKNALNMAGIEFSGREHDALDDARSTSKLLRVFRNRELFEMVFGRVAEAMKPSHCGTCIGDMFDMSAFYVA